MIEDYRFGSISIAGCTYRGDVKIVCGRVVADWWRKEGHSLDIPDVDDVLEARPRVLVVGMGMPGRMQTTKGLREALTRAGVKLVEEPTAEAVASFNRLHASGEDVAGAFHLTC